MEPGVRKPGRESLFGEYFTKIALTTLFIALFLGFARWAVQQDDFPASLRLDTFDLALLGFATFRLGRLIAYSAVMEPLRAPFTVTVPDETGAGQTVAARGSGARFAIGQLISCPICAGTWCAALLVYGLYGLPGPTRIFLYMTAAIGLAELVNALVEALSWSGQLTRTQIGERRK